MKVTPTQFRLQKLEAALSAVEYLETAGVLFYGSEACAIDDAKSALQNAISDTLWDDYEAEAQQ